MEILKKVMRDPKVKGCLLMTVYEDDTLGISIEGKKISEYSWDFLWFLADTLQKQYDAFIARKTGPLSNSVKCPHCSKDGKLKCKKHYYQDGIKVFEELGFDTSELTTSKKNQD